MCVFYRILMKLSRYVPLSYSATKNDVVYNVKEALAHSAFIRDRSVARPFEGRHDVDGEQGKNLVVLVVHIERFVSPNTLELQSA